MTTNTFTSTSASINFDYSFAGGVWQPLKEVATLYTVTVTKDEEVDVPTYFAEVMGNYPPMIGLGDMPEEAFYDLCEIIAEWGLDGEGRDYPPSLWQRFKWWVVEGWYNLAYHFRNRKDD